MKILFQLTCQILLAIGLILHLCNFAWAEITYFDVKRSMSNSYTPEISIMMTMTDLISGGAANIFEDGYRPVPNGLPLVSCGVQSAFIEDDKIVSPENERFSEGNIGNPRLYHNMQYFTYVARAILEIKWSLNHYSVPTTTWKNNLVELERTLRRGYVRGSDWRQQAQFVTNEISKFAINLGTVSSKFGPRSLAASHACGGGLYAFVFSVSPTHDVIELVPAIYYEDCQAQGKRPDCHQISKSATDGDIAALSGQYYYRSTLNDKYRRININKKHRSAFSLIRQALAVGRRDLDRFDGFKICFVDGQVVRNGECL